jgi:aryl-alcohol dehydrogenase-like predicted oxidoreductase
VTPLPTRILGRTGVQVPILGLGTAPAGHRPEEQAIPFFQRCLDAGLTHVDTGPQVGGYGLAQRYLGEVVPERRDELFVATRVSEPEGGEARRQLEQNLQDLKIDRADLVYVQSLGGNEMRPEVAFSEGGVWDALVQAKREGLTRFVGVSGHCRPWRYLKALEEWDLDVLLNAVNVVTRHIYRFEQNVWPFARQRDVGLVGMKIFGGVADSKESAKGANLPDDLKQQGLRWALGLDGLAGVVIGLYDDDELAQVLDWVRSWQPLDAEELVALEAPTRQLAASWYEPYGPVV